MVLRNRLSLLMLLCCKCPSKDIRYCDASASISIVFVICLGTLVFMFNKDIHISEENASSLLWELLDDLSVRVIVENLPHVPYSEKVMLSLENEYLFCMKQLTLFLCLIRFIL